MDDDEQAMAEKKPTRWVFATARGYYGTGREALPAKPWSSTRRESSYLLKPEHTNHNMSDHSRYYITGAFVLGAIVALGYQNLRLPERNAAPGHQLGKEPQAIFKDTKPSKQSLSRKSFLNPDAVAGEIVADIKEGIEGCIGGTPLIKIKSLSEATGCEILAKAEVNNFAMILFRKSVADSCCAVPQWRREQPERPGCSKHHPNGRFRKLVF